MFKIVVNDGTQELPDDDIYYIVAKEGIFLKKKIGVMESIAPVDKISILKSADTMARMYINPIPAQMGAKILGFFKAVYEKFRGEAIVLLFYNEKTGKYRVVPPTQKVTAAGCDYNRGIVVKGFTMIGTIHSHANFSAFHSGTDDSDEKTFDGLHITYGHVTSENFTLSASIVSNGHRFIVQPEDYMLGLEKTKDVDKTKVSYTTKIYKANSKGKMVFDKKASNKTAYSNRLIDKRYMFKVPESKRQFNPKWMDMVERGTYVYSYAGYGGYGWQNRARGGAAGWGGNYDPSVWNQAGRFIPPGQRQLPGFVGQKPGTPAVVVKPDDNKKCDPTNPCLSCKNRNIKIINEIDGIEYEDEMYQCDKCKVIFTTTDVDAKCPKCKADDHLIIIDEKDLTDNHVQGSPTAIDKIDQDALLASGLASSIDDIQPDQCGYVDCSACGNTFLMLETDECCPHCQVLISSTDDEIEWKCPHCSGVFSELDMKVDGECPYCNSQIELVESDSEEEEMTDKGSFLDQSDEEHQAILDAAAEADKNLERIPDPEKPQQIKPLATSLLQKMKKVFGGGNDTVH